MTRQLRRAALRASYWGKWHCTASSIPCDDKGPISRRVRRKIALSLARNHDRKATVALKVAA